MSGSTENGAGEGGASLHLAGFLPYRLSITSNAVSDLIAREYQARFGLRIPEWRVMAVLGEADGGGERTQRELVEATRMDKVTVNRAAKALTERGLIARRPHDRDGRSHGLMLSAAGAALYREIAPAAVEMDGRLSAVFAPEDKAMLETLLDRLRASADAIARETDI